MKKGGRQVTEETERALRGDDCVLDGDGRGEVEAGSRKLRAGESASGQGEVEIRLASHQ